MSGNRKGQHFPVLIKLNSGAVGSGTEMTTVTFNNLFPSSVCSCADLSVDWSIVFRRETHKVPQKKETKDNSGLC